jgi:hypothetical protein
MVTSGRGPSDTDVDCFTAAARAIKAEFPQLELCVSLEAPRPAPRRLLANDPAANDETVMIRSSA